jgi:ribosomal protein S25
MNIEIQKKVLKLLGNERVITSSELAKHLSVSWNTAEKYLLELVIEGKIVKIKKQGVNLWLKK